MLSFRSTTVFQVFAGILLFGPAPTKAQSNCNANGIPDACDLSCGQTGGPCDVPGCGTAADCHDDGVQDVCELSCGPPASPCDVPGRGPSPVKYNAAQKTGAREL
ncbi:MAG: hypothetical protein V1790_11775 [Planctomycetota bacterium]